MAKNLAVGDIVRHDMSPTPGRLWRVDEIRTPDGESWRGTIVFDMDQGPNGRQGSKERRWFNSRVFVKCDEAYTDTLIGTLRNLWGLTK